MKHVLASCPLYKPLRNRCFGNIQENDITNLIKCFDRVRLLKFVIIYIMKALKLRKDTLLIPKF